MGCPFFEPQRPLEPGDWTEYWTHRPRLPLGEAYSGICRAGDPHTPSKERQRELCNCGYARGRCENFPKSSAVDAVRFSVISNEPLRVIYILEKDYAPLEHGEFDPNGEPDSVLAHQARAFAQSYRKQRAAAAKAQAV